MGEVFLNIFLVDFQLEDTFLTGIFEYKDGMSKLAMSLCLSFLYCRGGQ